MVKAATNMAGPGEPEFDTYADSYAEAVNKSLGVLGGMAGGVDYFTRVKAGYVADLVAGHFGAQFRPDLLDVGCGVGNFHGLLSGIVASLSGCDVSGECLKTAAGRHPHASYRHYDGGVLPFDDASFDCAMTVCVMHHVPVDVWPGFVREMKRVLRPGGLALVFEHNPLNPLTRRIVSNCEFDADAVLLGRGRTTGLLAEGGFSEVSARSILSVPSFGPATRRIDRLFARLPLGAQYYARGTA